MHLAQLRVQVMTMHNQQNKIQLREAIKEYCQSEDSYYREVDDQRALIRCPFCGDSSNLHHAHCYIIFNTDNDYKPGFICHKCGEHGAVTEDFLTALGLSDANTKALVSGINSTSRKRAKNGYGDETELNVFEYKRPPVIRGRKTKYIEDRLGRAFTDQELVTCKTITSLHQFLVLNKISAEEYRYPLWQMNILERDYVGFLTYGNSHILLRDITGTHELSWVKYPISSESSKNRVIYTLETALDPYETRSITINIGEGVMDIISVAYNLGYNKENTLNVCITGNHYEQFLIFLIDLGFIGSNVNINIFPDNDAAFNQKAKKKTDLYYFQKLFRKAKYLFGDIYVYYNIIGKDCGVPRDQIKLKKFKL